MESCGWPSGTEMSREISTWVKCRNAVTLCDFYIFFHHHSLVLQVEKQAWKSGVAINTFEVRQAVSQSVPSSRPACEYTIVGFTRVYTQKIGGNFRHCSVAFGTPINTVQDSHGTLVGVAR